MKARRCLSVIGCLVVVLLIGVVAVACGESEPTTTAGPTTTEAQVARSILECPQGPPSGETPEYGGTLTIIYDHSPTNLGLPFESTRFLDWIPSRFAVEGLVGLNEKSQPVAQLATSWDVDDTAKTITLQLREGVKFHDGTDFDAEACKWNLEMQKNGPKADLDAVTAIEVVDPYTVKLTFSTMDPLFIQKLVSSQAGKIVSPTAYEVLGSEEMQFHPVGTGPFKFESFVPDVSLNYAAFEDYWQEGLPYLDAVVIKYVADRTVAATSFKSGEAQILGNVDMRDVPEYETMGCTIERRLNAIWNLAADSVTQGQPGADIRVRQAIAYAIDAPTITKAVWDGAFGYTNQIATEGMKAYNSSIKGYSFDPEKAKELLAEVGITPETPWKTKLYTPNPEDRVEYLTVVQQQLKAVGIDVQLEALAPAAFNQISSDGWPGSLAIASFSYNFETDYSATLQSSYSRDAHMNPSIWIPDDYDAVYRDMLSESDFSEREAAFKEINRMLIDDYCLLTPLFTLPGIIAVAPELHDSTFLVDCTPEWLPERAWLEQ